MSRVDIYLTLEDFVPLIWHSRPQPRKKRGHFSPPPDHLFLTLSSDPLTVIGSIGLKPGADITSHTGEIGYWIAEEHQRKGLISEALAGFLEWTFVHRTGDGSAAAAAKPEVKKTRVVAHVFAENTVSMLVLEKCGFVKEGVQRGQVVTRGGVLMDLHLYGLTVGDWEVWRDRRREREEA